METVCHPIIRSGDVIPKIVEVIKEADIVGLPPEGTYEWNTTNVDIIARYGEDSLDEQYIQIRIRKLEHFFNQLETDYLRKGNIKKLYELGYKTIRDYVHISSKDIEKLPGFKGKSAINIETSVKDALRKASFVDIISASNSLGRGFSKKKLNIIFKNYRQAFDITIPITERRQGLAAISGMGSKTIEQFLNNLPLFYQFVEENDITLPSYENATGAAGGGGAQNSNISGKFYGMKILFTGIRNKALEKNIAEEGGEIVSNISKNTTILIAKDPSGTSGKLKKARSLGIEIISLDNFKKKYF